MFNTDHARLRAKIECQFGIVKGRWHRLHYLDMELENASTVLVNGFILHNMANHLQQNYIHQECTCETCRMGPIVGHQDYLGNDEVEDDGRLGILARQRVIDQVYS